MALRILAIALFSTLAACTWGDKILSQPTEDHLAEPKEWVAAADWSNPEEVTAVITEYEFQPKRLVFEAGKPYRLKIINRGAFEHAFSSSGFFESIAVRRLETASGKTLLPVVERLVFEPDEEKELLFVAVKTGEHKLECNTALHFGLGPWAANGTIVVQ
ncbi:MAG TPA: hypothetical protein QGF63_18515 [Alphaproteobacteria bacterium]|jgi:uncharacterized cupredoxin-like copper-binding protein|nr:hypothetical protein [Alphaproteobacteria bacterium]MDP7164353.1 hypothetical protein [Alphaproteobacteria bacterium]MDP7426945.1 hypothetical protein [Alphaproteobacteria bacterium]HJM51820.1 hypothetical protein [Alphaproteobacteria bacterium]|tara:strand:+ start:185 stop:664 length:480 start_codon:yes stop_codon:yes gene_type:complete